MSEESKLPVELAEPVAMLALPMALQVFFNEALFDRCRLIAKYIAGAEGFTPAHLVGKPEACFAIVSRALTWKQDPFAVACATYQTPNKQIGYFGSLCQSIIESSGRLEGGVKFTHFGDWSAVQRKFKIVESSKGNKYPAPNWPDAAEEGLGVTVSAQVKGEAEPRTLDFYLAQAWPRNSTLWATDPMTQIKYTAVRRFATSVAPSLFMGVPFDREDAEAWSAGLKDITPPPRPRREDFVDKPHEPEPERPFVVADMDGEIQEFVDPVTATIALAEALKASAKRSGEDGVEGVWESNAMLISTLRAHGRGDLGDALRDHYYAGALRDASGEPAPSIPASPGATRPAEAQERAGAAPGSSQPPAPVAIFDGAVIRPAQLGDHDHVEQTAPSAQAAAEVGTSVSAVASPAASMFPIPEWIGRTELDPSAPPAAPTRSPSVYRRR